MKKELLTRAAENYQDFSRAAFLLSKKELEAPGLIEERAFRDVIAHVVAWQLIAATAIIEIRAGIKRSVDYKEDTVIDAFNATVSESFSGFPTERLFGLLANTQRVIVSIVETLTNEELTEDGKANEWFAAETFEHYQEHLPQLKEYLTSRGKTNGRSS